MVPAFEKRVWILLPEFGLTHAEIENWVPKFVDGNVIVLLEPLKVKTPQLVEDEYVTLLIVPVKLDVVSVTSPDPEYVFGSTVTSKVAAWA
jgi:hypothetical protein